MKKIFTLVGLAALSFGLNAQSSVLLNETFNGGNPSENLSTTSNYLLEDDLVYLDFTSEENIINLQYTLNPSDFEADSITAAYDLTSMNTYSEIDTADGYLSVSLFKIAMVSIASKTFYPYTVLYAEEEISGFSKNEDSYTITKGFTGPYSNAIDVMNLEFTSYYTMLDNNEKLLAIGSTPSEMAESFCSSYFVDETELTQCIDDVILATPEITPTYFAVDNVKITSHKVTGVEGSSTTRATPVKAFNTLGKEVSLDTKNEAIIVIYSDGSSVREYNTK